MRDHGPARSAATVAVVGVAILVLYLVHLSPTTGWGDTADLHHAAGRKLELDARGYPLFVALERLALHLPSADRWYPANVLSALFGAIAAALVFAVVRRLTDSEVAGLVGALAHAAGHTVFSYAVITEVYSLNHLFLALWILLLLRIRDGHRGSFPLLLFTAGMALAHHRILGLFVVPAALALWPLRARLRPATIGLGALALLLGVLPLLLLAARDLSAGTPIGELLRLYLTGDVKKALFNADPVAFAKSTALYLAYLAYEFPGPVLLLAPVGLVALWRGDRFALVLLASTYLVTTIFAIGYRHHGIWIAYNTHGFLIVAIVIGVGAAAVLRRFGESAPGRAGIALLAMALVPLVLYPAVPSVLARLDLRPFQVRHPDRFHRWFLVPGKRGDSSALLTAREILDAVPPGSVVLGDWGVFAPLRLVRDREGGGDVRLELYGGEDATGILDGLPEGAPVYLAHFPHYDPRFVSETHELGAPVRRGLPLRPVLPRDR